MIVSVAARTMARRYAPGQTILEGAEAGVIRERNGCDERKRESATRFGLPLRLRRTPPCPHGEENPGDAFC
jgi:hypothetical protein